jgi:hypothetical protein
MIIDLVTAAGHQCNGRCSELAELKRVLQLKNYEIDMGKGIEVLCVIAMYWLGKFAEIHKP